jgi:hypothetical protein
MNHLSDPELALVILTELAREATLCGADQESCLELVGLIRIIDAIFSEPTPI